LHVRAEELGLLGRGGAVDHLLVIERRCLAHGDEEEQADDGLQHPISIALVPRPGSLGHGALSAFDRAGRCLRSCAHWSAASTRRTRAATRSSTATRQGCACAWRSPPCWARSARWAGSTRTPSAAGSTSRSWPCATTPTAWPWWARSRWCRTPARSTSAGRTW